MKDAKVMNSTKVFSLGGSLIVPDDIDTLYLKKFKEMILNYISDGNRVVIVCGGGKICRRYNDAAKELTDPDDTELDKMGIAATKLNAELVRILLKEHAHEYVVKDPTKKIETDKSIIVASGYKPGNSSDKVAVMLAQLFNATDVINMTNIDMVYDSDPKKNPGAKPRKEINASDFLEIIGEKWEPGKNVPFDPVASRLAMESGIDVVILNGKNLQNLSNYLDNKEFTGSIIKAE